MVSYQETLVSTSVTVMAMWCSAGWATADMASPSIGAAPARAHCPDRIGEKDDKEAAGSYHQGAPSDPAGPRYVVWRAWPSSSGARTSSNWFAELWLRRAASGARPAGSGTAAPEAARAGW